jgi:uncharacterized RDD family membrane protein YckC
MEVNPYQAPVEDVAPEIGPDSELLASRGSRFAAALIDGVANIVVYIGLFWGLGLMNQLASTELSQQLINAAFAFGIWFAINVAFLLNGQTLGKRLIGIRMVDYTTGATAPLGRLLLLRYLPTSLVSAIPKIGPFLTLIDVLFIFGGEQRCIHDHIAGTKVVQA